MALKNNTNILSGIPKSKKAVMYLMEKWDVLDKFHSGINYVSFVS